MNSNITQENMHAESNEFLSFFLGEEHYALDIMTVKEIRGYETVTKIANAPSFIKGVINLRGDIVPIIDLRIKFSVGEATYTEFTIVIMLNVCDRIVGIVVDGVSDVIKLQDEDIRPPPEFGVAFDSKYLLGLASLEEHMVILVNIESLISSDELGLFDNHATTKE
ncbi:chemotaxis protein CheW [Paraglaciecola chathamensis]|jgi:purine-binding chemotaxis protein CheW|uniref:Chemotaxis protein CheW n=2 Tax=Paraglaciecola chathamensis TaxID=368405 RepID=A0A8H9IG69_9ALTE|nr:MULTISPECIES: chemotaxis protein CheW [Paraglaciecola]MBJ2136264.1 chemotaxis protein CheW [Paraglaciecola chathamensis]MBN26531.1 chemotaxis protein CheW [Alteromonadaceae bacterium]GAC09528.1 purine-binding chemotaxis protein CheW [Paraglaciecola chathamensis S18K6]GGZ66993.1 chemotaxis protein CheW [Paraglaciecola oceanifecundans]|tara:strand:- start:67831 stop:68328 length:498 start_codon:yes stop_codon:yes gene_type:complete